MIKLRAELTHKKSIVGSIRIRVGDKRYDISVLKDLGANADGKGVHRNRIVGGESITQEFLSRAGLKHVRLHREHQ